MLEKINLDPSSSYSWNLLFLLPKAILFSPLRGGKNSGQSLKTTIENRI
jgi:hypothetical protein